MVIIMHISNHLHCVYTGVENLILFYLTDVVTTAVQNCVPQISGLLQVLLMNML